MQKRSSARWSVHGPASPLLVIHRAAAADDQVGTFPHERSDGNPSAPGQIPELSHLGLGKLDLGADHRCLRGHNDINRGIMTAYADGNHAG